MQNIFENIFTPLHEDLPPPDPPEIKMHYELYTA
jgi:hypothetical protein